MSDQKSITFYVTTDLVYDQRMQRICAAINSAGTKVHLVGRKKKQSAALEERSYSQQRMKCLFTRGPLFYLEMNIRIFFHLIFSKAHLAVAADTDTLAGVALASRVKSIGYVYDAHEWFPEVPELEGRPLVKKIWQQVERLFIPGASLCYTVNHSLATILQEKYGKEFEIIRNLPVLKSDVIPKTEKNRIILYQGALNAGRGIEASIMAMQQLAEYELWLVGEGDLSTSLRNLVDSLNLQMRIKFFGYRTPEELLSITKNADIGLNLLEGASKNYYYSLANKFFDYMHAGIPSINMRFPEYQHILAKYPCGTMIEACTPDSVSTAIRSICENETDYHAMWEMAITTRKLFHWDLEKGRLMKLFHDLH